MGDSSTNYAKLYANIHIIISIWSSSSSASSSVVTITIIKNYFIYLFTIVIIIIEMQDALKLGVGILVLLIGYGPAEYTRSPIYARLTQKLVQVDMKCAYFVEKSTKLKVQSNFEHVILGKVAHTCLISGHT